MTPLEILDAYAAASWNVTPALGTMLDDATIREQLHSLLPERPSSLQRELVIALMQREMRYRSALWDGEIEDTNDRYENLYRCAFMLYRMGHPEDAILLWRVKRLKEPLNNSEVPRAMDGALADQARKGMIRRERVRTCAGLAASEWLQDGVIQTFLNMDVGCTFGAEYFVGAGIDTTLDHLATSDAPEAGELAAYIRGAFIDGEWSQWQPDWERQQSEYYWPV